MAPKTDRRNVQGEESRIRILDATIDIAAERGYEGTSISLVSKHSGLPASSIYWHFTNKDELFAAVIQRSFDEWATGLWDIETEATSYGDALRSQALALLASPEFLRLGLMLSLERRPNEPRARALFLDVRAETLAALERTFRRVLTDAGHHDERLSLRLARLIMATADGLFVAAQVDQTEAEFTDTLDLMISMIEQLVARSG